MRHFWILCSARNSEQHIQKLAESAKYDRSYENRKYSEIRQIHNREIVQSEMRTFLKFQIKFVAFIENRNFYKNSQF